VISDNKEVNLAFLNYTIAGEKAPFIFLVEIRGVPERLIRIHNI